MAHEVGQILGYSDEGGRFVKLITQRWARELIEGTDYLRITGAELRDFRDAAEQAGLGTHWVPSRTPHLILLLESGLHLACIKTRCEFGVRLRRFLVDEVLPQITRTGRYAPEAAPDSALEARARALDLEDRRFKVETLRGVLGELRSMNLVASEVYAAHMAVAAEIATGTSLNLLKPPTEDTWRSPTQIARQLGVSAQRVGLAISALGIRGNIEGVARAIINKSPHSNRTVTSYLYSPAAVQRIEVALGPHREA